MENDNDKDRIVKFLELNPNSSTETIAFGLNIPTYSVLKHMGQLNKYGETERSTSKTTSYWRLKKKS